VPKDFILSVANIREKLNQTYRNYRYLLSSYTRVRVLLLLVRASEFTGYASVHVFFVLTKSLTKIQEDSQHFNCFVDES
jgi:hypothetical protein